MSSTALSLPKNRFGRPSVSVAGVLCIIGGALGIVTSAILLLTSPTFPRVLQLLVGGLLLVMGVFGIITGWGLLRRLWWAQIAAIMWTVVLLTPSSPLPHDLGSWIGQLIFMGTGVWWLFLFIGRSADEEFDANAHQALPAAVVAVACILIIDIFSIPFAWVLDAPTFFFGHSIPATYSKPVSVTMCGLAFALGVSLLKRSKLGFWLVVALQTFYFASALVTDFTPKALSDINVEISSLLAKWHLTEYAGIGRTFGFIEPGVIALLLLLSWQRYRQPDLSKSSTRR